VKRSLEESSLTDQDNLLSIELRSVRRPKTDFKELLHRRYYPTHIAKEKSQHSMFDSILMARPQVSSAGSLMQHANHFFSDAFKVQKLHIHRIKENIVVGNSCSLDLVHRSHPLDTELTVQIEKITALNKMLN